MPTSASSEMPYTWLGRLNIAPFGARTNGLPGLSWVPLLDLDPNDANAALEALREVRVAACVAPQPAPARSRLRRDARPILRLWVDVTGRAVAEDLLRALLPAPRHGR